MTQQLQHMKPMAKLKLCSILIIVKEFNKLKTACAMYLSKVDLFYITEMWKHTPDKFWYLGLGGGKYYKTEEMISGIKGPSWERWFKD